MVVEIVEISSLNDLKINLALNMGEVVTLGNFDGLHKGHKKLISKVVNLALEKNLISSIVTFNPHPAEILGGISENFYISSLDEKLKDFEDLGIKKVYLINFDLSFSKVLAEDFLDSILGNINIKYLIVGSGFSFGYKRKGNTEMLKVFAKKKDFDFEEFKVINVEEGAENYLNGKFDDKFDAGVDSNSDSKQNNSKGEKISSSILRDELKRGNLEKFNYMKGRNYFFKGRIIHGDGRGKEIGFPTINIDFDKRKILPRLGVYGVKINIGENGFFGIMNVGVRPTFSSGKKHS
ncbi:MAG: hypothetical protein KC550_05390, partial [Nanoarchaeota archaeon]|nr:hypothetical protein [Nanoarchaeota archaeon]